MRQRENFGFQTVESDKFDIKNIQKVYFCKEISGQWENFDFRQLKVVLLPLEHKYLYLQGNLAPATKFWISENWQWHSRQRENFAFQTVESDKFAIKHIYWKKGKSLLNLPIKSEIAYQAKIAYQF